MARYNLDSPNHLTVACDLERLSSWFLESIEILEDEKIRGVISYVCKNLDAFVKTPRSAILLWNGCNRIAEEGKKQKYHKYPCLIKQMARDNRWELDTRPNGPAIASFLFAGGDRPKRWGSKNSWSIHHIYSGKFPYPERSETLHAKTDGKHFTQSAGLIAVHPVADGLCDEYPSFTWLLRAHSFQKFGYDPDCAFSSDPHDEFGFILPFRTSIFYP